MSVLFVSLFSRVTLPFVQQSPEESVTNAPVMMPTEEHGEDSTSTVAPSRLEEEDHSAAAETGPGLEGDSGECQYHQREDTVATQQVDKLLQDEKPEAGQVLSNIVLGGHVGDTGSSQEEGCSAAAETGPGLEDSEERQSHQKQDSWDTQDEKPEAGQALSKNGLGGCVGAVVSVSELPEDNVSSEAIQHGIRKGTQKQEDAQDAVKMPKRRRAPHPQSRAPTPATTKKQPSHKSRHKEEKRKRKAAMDSPQQLSDKQEMVLSALKEIWDVCELGRGPKDLAQLKAPCPSEHYLEIHGQHLKTVRKYDYLQVRHL